MNSLRHDVSRYLRKNSKLTQSGFGRLVVSDPMLVSKLRNGYEPTKDMETRVRDFMTQYPDGPPDDQRHQRGWEKRRAEHGPTGRKPPPSKFEKRGGNAI